MKVKTGDLTGPALDWAVANCEGENFAVQRPDLLKSGVVSPLPYSTDPAQGHPIIEREGIGTAKAENDLDWLAMRRYSFQRDDAYWCGPTALIAAMRCYVASKLGDEVEIPESLA